MLRSQATDHANVDFLARSAQVSKLCSILKSTLAQQRRLARRMQLVPNKGLYTISVRKAGKDIIPMLPHSLAQIVSHPDVPRTVPLTQRI